MDEVFTYALLGLSAFLAGAVNAVAGGGTLLTFPALTAVVDSVAANATSTVALMPGSFASTIGYRNELLQTRRMTLWLILPSVLGGALGAWLVLLFPAKVFNHLVPWLILMATLLFLVQPRVARYLGTHPHTEPRGMTFVVILIAQFFIALYGGYFGAGIGILMLSTLAFIGVGDIHSTNAVKTLLAAVINVCAVAVFLTEGRVNWHYAWPMVVSAILGGYYGARLARRMKREYIRGTVIVIGLGVSAYYFARDFGWV